MTVPAGERPSPYSASLAELCAYTSEETAIRAEQAERAQAALDAGKDARFERMWRALRVGIASALSAPAAPRPTAERPLPASYSQPYADGQVEALRAVLGAMRDAEDAS